jgi:6-pyruvoyltetrahydropterin/6-carboxytetrahydropterin synthase
MAFFSTKTYGHEQGLSCCFRQWRAEHSHCHNLHGYALAVRVVFEAGYLDPHGWVIDFGSLKPFKASLKQAFDHKTIIAADDPQLSWFVQGKELGLLDLVIVEAVGCEQFAVMVYGMAQDWLSSGGHSPRCKVSSVKVSEHGANSAIYQPGPDSSDIG